MEGMAALSLSDMRRIHHPNPFVAFTARNLARGKT